VRLTHPLRAALRLESPTDCQCVFCGDADNILRLAVLLPSPSSSADAIELLAAAFSAANTLNGDSAGLLGGKQLEIVWRAVSCDAFQSTAAISQLREGMRVDAVIGPPCDLACESSAFLAAGLNLLQISYACTSPLLSDKAQYPTVRTTTP
jgi:hypothetical protein